MQPIDHVTLPEHPVGGEKLSVAFLREHRVYPFAESSEGLMVAMADTSDLYAIRAIGLATGLRVLAHGADPVGIDAAIDRWARHGERNASEPVTANHASLEDDLAGDDAELLKDIALATPVIQFVNDLLQDALYSRATDIHVEPFARKLKIRARVDGVLRDVDSPPLNMARSIVSRFKILAGLDIAERRLPQDGRIRVRLGGRQIDLRVATMPTIHGEAVAIRLLDNVRRTMDLAALGFGDGQRDALTRQLGLPHGMILVTGPTGSGKTTTLATALTMLNNGERKILTIEDPIEYELDGVNQTQVRPGIGLTFAGALRSFLRHDPDVIMVGEMRDGETAGIGVHAALTGHIVLSTLHTNSAAAAVTRLLDMGIDGYLLASSLRCIVGQRLVRVLCQACREPCEAPTDLVGLFGITGHDFSGPQQQTIWNAVGCDRCQGSGYENRTSVSEVLVIDDEIRALIGPYSAPGDIEAAAVRKGMQTMLHDGIRKCLAGITTVEEVRRVTLTH